MGKYTKAPNCPPIVTNNTENETCLGLEHPKGKDNVTDKRISSAESFTFPEELDDDDDDFTNTNNNNNGTTKIQPTINTTSYAKKDKPSSSNDDILTTQSQKFVGWREEQGTIGNLATEKHNIRVYVNTYLFSKLKFITDDSKLENNGMVYCEIWQFNSKTHLVSFCML